MKFWLIFFAYLFGHRFMFTFSDLILGQECDEALWVISLPLILPMLSNSLIILRAAVCQVLC